MTKDNKNRVITPLDKDSPIHVRFDERDVETESWPNH